MADGVDGLDFTNSAWESLYDAVDDVDFPESDAQLIYDSLKHRLRSIPFGDYLKRYIYIKAGLDGGYDKVEIKVYQQIIRDSFADNNTPPSFSPTTAKLSALSKNWLTQQTVSRKVVFLLGFGLGMCVDDVNLFLTKALREVELNPKDPFEVICWYCYKNGYNYLKFEKLWSIYADTPPNTLDMNLIYSEYTIGVRNTLHSIHNDAALISYLSKLKTSGNQSRISVTAREHFDRLYDEARDLIANLYNHSEEEKNDNAVREYQRKLEFNDRMNDYEKRQRIEKLRADRQIITRDDITESDIERVICSAIPTDRHGNLVPSKASKLNEQFAGKRFSRQHIGEILAGKAEINRFDLITLNFFIFSQKVDKWPNAKRRYVQFLESTNEILNSCFMGQFYIQNPYECFVLMCILSDDPLGTYADVWELSYDT